MNQRNYKEGEWESKQPQDLEKTKNHYNNSKKKPAQDSVTAREGEW